MPRVEAVDILLDALPGLESEGWETTSRKSIESFLCYLTSQFRRDRSAASVKDGLQKVCHSVLNHNIAAKAKGRKGSENTLSDSVCHGPCRVQATREGGRGERGRKHIVK
jgi:hypothetical protein